MTGKRAAYVAEASTALLDAAIPYYNARKARNHAKVRDRLFDLLIAATDYAEARIESERARLED